MQELRFYSPQWLYSTCFGLTCGHIQYVLLMMGEIIARNM